MLNFDPKQFAARFFELSRHYRAIHNDHWKEATDHLDKERELRLQAEDRMKSALAEVKKKERIIKRLEKEMHKLKQELKDAGKS